MQKFIILTTQRTGSTMLWRYLNQHPDMDVSGEIFMRKNKSDGTYASFRRKNIKNRLYYFLNRKMLINSYLADFFKQRSKSMAVGFKLMYGQVNESLLQWLIENDVKIIHLIRKNTLKMILSRMTAKKRKLYHTDQYRAIKIIQVPLDPQKTKNEIKRSIQTVDLFRSKVRNLESLEIYYEDISTNISNQAKIIYDFLNLSHFECEKIPLKKINPDSIESLVLNYADICQAFTGTEYEKYLQ